MLGESGQTEIVLGALLVAFQWVCGEILRSLSRHSECVSSTRFLFGSSLTLLSGSCHDCIMPQAMTPRILDCVSRNATFRKRVRVQLVDATPSELKALITGGVYDRKKTYTAFCDAKS